MQCHNDIPIDKVAYLYLSEVGTDFITHGENLALSIKATSTYCEEPVDQQQ